MSKLSGKTKFKFSSISDAIEDIKNGKMVVVVDDEDRENEGDLVLAAHFATPDSINFMIKHARGLVCLPATDAILNGLELKDMVQDNTDQHKTAFTISVDASPDHGVSTGISAADRATTIQLFINPSSTKNDFVTPGHIFPLRAREMGVLKRAGHTEAAVDLSRLAGLSPAGVICEIMNEDGSMSRLEQLYVFSKKHNLKIITIADLIRYRIAHESFIKRDDVVSMPTRFGEFKVIPYLDIINQKTHLALFKGDLSSQNSVLTRIHSECLTGDILGSLRCDCGPQLNQAMRMIEAEGVGLVLYMRQEGRGIGLANKLKAYKLQEEGLDTVEANHALGFPMDLRDYGVGAQILLDLGIQSLDLLTNNPKKIVGLEGYGIKINKRIPIEISSNCKNKDYLKTKSSKMGHLLKGNLD